MNQLHHASKVLIVDDTPANIDVLMESLSQYDLSVATQGIDALEILPTFMPELILLDVMMPGMSGFQVCKEIKKIPDFENIPIIFLTALNSKTDETEGLELGAVDYITKPFNPGIVKLRVGNQLELKYLRDDLKRLVEDRTLELRFTYQQLEKLDIAKTDFLHMISHELRTPANGLIGVSSILVDELLSDSEEHRQMKALYHRCRDRMELLFSQATLLCDLRLKSLPKLLPTLSVKVLTDKLRMMEEAGLISIQPYPLESTNIVGSRELYQEVFDIIEKLVHCFVTKEEIIPVSVHENNDDIWVEFSFKKCDMSSEEGHTFFELGSSVRNSSHAEPLGLSPILAHDIMTLWGGDVRWDIHDDQSGCLLLVLPKRDNAKGNF